MTTKSKAPSELSVVGIDIGKDANFAVLDNSPYTVAPEAIRDIDVVATVFEGRVFAVEMSEPGAE